MPILCHWCRLFVSLQLGISSESECLCPTLGMSCARLVVPPPPVSLRRVDCLIAGFLMAIVVGIVYGWPIEPHFLRDISSVRHQPLWLWCHWWNHSFMPQWMWYPLLRGMPLQYGFINYIITITVDDKHWIYRAKSAALLVIHTLFRPLHQSEPLKRYYPLSWRKLAGEGKLYDHKEWLGWDIHTHSLIVFLQK